MVASESIIRPKPFKSFHGERVVYVPVDVPSGSIQKHLRKNSSFAKTTEWGTLFQLDDKTVLFQAMGAPLAVMTLERLIAGEAKEIYLLGFCGSLDPRLKIGTAVSLDKALAEEGTSRHYAPRKKYFMASPDLRRSIEKKLTSGRLPFVRAAGVTTDAPFRETPAWLRSMRRRGCDTVDMEASAVFALAGYRRVQAGALLVVSDELFSEKWQHGFFGAGLEDKVKEYFFPFLS